MDQSGTEQSQEPEALIAFIQEGLSKQSNSVNARAMAAYMKTEMPFYGVKTPQRRPLFKQAVKRFPVANQEAYEEAVLAIWNLPHREEKYGAIELAWGHKKFINSHALPLYEQLIVEGAWWDLVDGVAPYLVGPLLIKEREAVLPVVERWLKADDVWLRRSAIITQIRSKDQTDSELLFKFCKVRAKDEEFWIRKAIGWALREYGKVAPEKVGEFLVDHKQELSPLSFKEAARNLV